MKLLQKDAKFNWSDECQKSFGQLKKLLTEAPMLIHPKVGKEFMIYNNASLNGLGCVLMQEGKVIAYTQKIETAQKELPNSWSRVSSHCVCSEELASLFIWREMSHLHKPQEFEIFDVANGT